MVCGNYLAAGKFGLGWTSFEESRGIGPVCRRLISVLLKLLGLEMNLET